MIPPDIQIELDKLKNRIASLEREKGSTVTHQDVERAVDKLEERLRPELNALKRRAG